MNNTSFFQKGPSFCWHCYKQLGGHHQKNKPITFSVITDPLGFDHRVHKSCVKDILRDNPNLKLKTKDAKE